jgi:hypothetical protein
MTQQPDLNSYLGRIHLLKGFGFAPVLSRSHLFCENRRFHSHNRFKEFQGSHSGHKKTKKKDLDNFQGFQIFGKKNSQWFSVLLVLIKITTPNFQWRFSETSFQKKKILNQNLYNKFMYVNGGDHSPFDNISTTFLSELSDARFIN